MAQNKALTYAEDALGVHKTFLESEDLVLQLRQDYNTRAGLETECRNLTDQIDRRKNELLIREAESVPEMAPTAFERHMKLTIAKDDELAKLYALRSGAMAHRDMIEATIRGHETNHKGFVARMNELGGYFNYLAAAKQAQVFNATLMTQVTDYPW